MGRVEVRVCAASNIGDVQRIGMPDPYVKVMVGDKKRAKSVYKTRVVSNSLNPVWDEVFKFQVADYDTTQVHFEVWNSNTLVDDLLGSYSLSLNGLTRGVVQDTWAILTGAKRSTAELHLLILAADFGRDPQPGATVVRRLEDVIDAPPPAANGGRPSPPSTTTTTAAATAPQPPTPPQTNPSNPPVSYPNPSAPPPGPYAGAGAPPPQPSPSPDWQTGFPPPGVAYAGYPMPPPPMAAPDFYPPPQLYAPPQAPSAYPPF